LRDWLLEHQNADGGWGYAPGKRSALEPTSLGLLALVGLAAGPKPVAQGCAWIRERCTPEGGFAGSAAESEPSWATPLAVLALRAAGCEALACAGALAWLLESSGRRIDDTSTNELDGSLCGWSWYPGTFSWVEPTAYAILAFKQDRRGDEARVTEGERLLYDRVCQGGGWNYGNRRVLGVDLVPFDQVTAKVLLALQDRRERKEVAATAEKTFSADLRRHRSTVTRGWEALARDAWGRPQTGAAEAVTEHLEADRELSTAALSFAVAGLAAALPGFAPFRLGGVGQEKRE